MTSPFCAAWTLISGVGCAAIAASHDRPLRMNGIECYLLRTFGMCRHEHQLGNICSRVTTAAMSAQRALVPDLFLDPEPPVMVPTKGDRPRPTSTLRCAGRQ